MSFIPLFSIRVKHDYYISRECHDLEFEPTQQTQRLIDGHRLRLQTLPDGISLWADTAADNKTALITLQHGVVFAFQLIIRNPDFNLFTDLTMFAGKLDPVYQNAEQKGKPLVLGDRESWQTETFVIPANTATISFILSGNPLVLDGDIDKLPQADDFYIEALNATPNIIAYDAATKVITIHAKQQKQDAKVSVRYRVMSVRKKNILADVELRYNKAMAKSDNNNEPFEIKFKARTGHWAYYLVTDQVGDFSIVDSNKSLVFSEVELPQTAEEDPLSDALSQQYPALRQIRFFSDESVQCSNEARKGIELRLGDERVRHSIPNPSIRRFSRIKKKVGSKMQEKDTLYQVVKHLRAP